jgi:hypothetical protein
VRWDRSVLVIVKLFTDKALNFLSCLFEHFLLQIPAILYATLSSNILADKI